MIVRVIAVDPRPKVGESDLRVYQVPENSREHQLLCELFDAARIEHETLVTQVKPRKVKRGV